jgi:hypothetical protein
VKFSELFKLATTQADNWFDPVLSVDTPLFIDPFLIYDQERGPFRGSHAEIVRFFKQMFTLIAKSGGNKQSTRYLKAVDDLIFPEVAELCLGYTQSGTKGAGSGSELGRLMAGAIWDAIETGLHNIKHFEEVAILRENIGPDRISDATANLLRHRLAAYTEQVCRRHQVPVKKVRYTRARYNPTHQRWVPCSFFLPINPYNGKPVLLVPEYYIRDLPTLDPTDFWEYCINYKADSLRREFNLDISRNVPKSQIVEVARKHVDWVTQYVQFREQRKAKPYNIGRDPKGFIKWYEGTQKFCGRHPLALIIDSPETFLKSVETLTDAFRHFVEENAGYRLLWNDNGTSRSERAAQLLFLGIVKHYCAANNVDVSPEPNIGRGPVDFKVSQGYRLRALLELKLARNTKFWDGAKKQLPTYLKAEKIRHGYFVVIVYTENDLSRVRRIKRIISDVNKAGQAVLKGISVDATPDKPSASHL